MNFLVHRMKPWLYIIIPLLLWAAPTQAQKRSIYTGLTLERIEGDTVLVAEIVPVFVFPRKIDTRKFAKLVENLKKVYPIAKEPVIARDGETHGNAQNRAGTPALHKSDGTSAKKTIHPRFASHDFFSGKITHQIDRSRNRTHLICIGQRTSQWI